MHLIATERLTRNQQTHHIRLALRRSGTTWCTHRLGGSFEILGVIYHTVIDQFQRCLFARICLYKEALHGRNYRIGS